LGLSIARNAVQRQGGRLWAENTGAGLRLNMRLVADDAIASRLAPAVDVCRPQMVWATLFPVGASLLAKRPFASPSLKSRTTGATIIISPTA